MVAHNPVREDQLFKWKKDLGYEEQGRCYFLRRDENDAILS